MIVSKRFQISSLKRQPLENRATDQQQPWWHARGGEESAMNAGKGVGPAILHCPGGEVSDSGKEYRGN